MDASSFYSMSGREALLDRLVDFVRISDHTVGLDARVAIERPEVFLMPHGKICYLEIPAKTAEASATFYSTIFGWTVRQRGDGNLAFDDTGSVSGTWVKESDRTPDEQTRIYIMVDSVASSLSQIEAAGGRVLTPRTDIGPGMGAFAVFADPVGNEFGLYEEPTVVTTNGAR